MRSARAQVRREFRDTGRTFLGARAARKVDPLSSPDTPAQKDDRLNPQVACKDEDLRKTLLQFIKAFVAEYQACLEEFRQGFTDVLFPGGTYKMVQCYNRDCDTLDEVPWRRCQT